MLVYVVIVLVALAGFSSLAVDWGRVQLAKTQLYAAADAAARAAATTLPSGAAAARTKAISVASLNIVDGQSLTLQSGDVLIGKWNTSTRTLDTSSSAPDAVQITARRTAARGNPIAHTFAGLIGSASTDLTVTTLAQAPAGDPQYGIVGLNWFNMSGVTRTGSYDSSAGTYLSGTAATDGSIACNSTMNLVSTASIGGTIYYNTGSAPSGGRDYDAKKKMTTAIATPASPTAGSYMTSNSNPSAGLPTSGANANISSSRTWPGGNYVLNTLNISGGTLTFSGPATIYLYGSLNMSGGIATYRNIPSNLKIEMCASAGVNMSSSGTLYAVIDAPTSPLNLQGTIVGSVMCSGIDMSGNAAIYYDTDLGPSGGSTTDGVSLQR